MPPRTFAVALLLAGCGRIGFTPVDASAMEDVRATSDASDVPDAARDGGPPGCPAMPEPPRPPCETYVGPAGDDAGGDGSRARPFATLGRAFAASAGGVCLLAGMYPGLDGRAIPSGAPGSVVVVAAEPGARSVLVPAAAGEWALEVGGIGPAAQHDIVLRDLELTGAGLLLDEESHDIAVVDVTVRGAATSGIDFRPATRTHTLLRVATDGTTSHGIAVRGSGHRVLDCRVARNTGGDYGIQVYDSTDDVLVRGCRISNGDGTGLFLGTGRNGTAINNVLVDNSGGGIRVDYDSTSARVEHNTVWGPGPGVFVGPVTSDARVENNLATVVDQGAGTIVSTNLDPVDALFVLPGSDFHLSDDATAIDAATSSDVCDDHDHLVRDALPDVGAHEHPRGG